MSDLVERSRKLAMDLAGSPLEEAAPVCLILDENADHIQSLERELSEVREALAKARDDTFELCAMAADGLAEMVRIGGIAGRNDPSEAELLDERYSQFAVDLRRQKSRAALNTKEKG